MSNIVQKRRIFTSNGGGGGSSLYPTVDAYTDLILLDPATHIDEIYLVKYPEGSGITGYYPSGLYISDGISWELLNNWTTAFNEDNFEIYGNVDNTKKLKFRVSTLPTNTELVLTVPSVDGVIATEDYVDTGLSTKEDSLGFTPEDVSNKDTTTTLGTSDTKYPSQNAVKVYTDIRTPAEIKLTAGNQTTSSNIASNITELVKTLEINKRYKVSGHLHIGCNNTGGVKIGVSVPAGATFFVTGIGLLSAATATSITNCILDSSGTLSNPVFCTSNSSLGYIKIDGEIQMSSTSGNLQFIFASAVNTQTSTIYQLGTYLQIKEML